MIGFICGIVLGLMIYHFIIKPDTVGTIRIDRSDPEDGPYLFLEVDDPFKLHKILNSKYVILQVSDKDLSAHK